MPDHFRLVLWLTAFAIAMANVEAAVVIHLHSIYYPDGPFRVFPLVILSTRDLAVELIREVATLIMILGVAMLAARGPVRVFVAFAYTFGLWDICYYAWLRLLVGWPRTWLEWDVLFLIPWPWLGPWLCPVSISLLLVAWGIWVLRTASAEAPLGFERLSATLFCFGAALVLAAFLWPAVPLLPGRSVAFSDYRPGEFPWSLFVVGYVVMAAGLWRLALWGRTTVANDL